MKAFGTLLVMTLIAGAVNAQQNIEGAWKSAQGGSEHHLFLKSGFFFYTVSKDNQFTLTKGGRFSVNGNELNALWEFNSADSANIGKKVAIPFIVTGNTLSVKLAEADVAFQRVDDGNAPLAGVWQITGRMGDDGRVAPIHQTGTRQTYKMLTGTKFQWVAIDPAKKQFSGTGGGSYTFKDGKYTEQIEFFSRDNSRVGASLTFDGKLENGEWHHSGLSSKGAKIYEVWGRTGD